MKYKYVERDYVNDGEIKERVYMQTNINAVVLLATRTS